MSGLTSHLTAAALLLHALVGCCWHQAHDCRHEHNLLAALGFEHHSAAEAADHAHDGCPSKDDSHEKDDCGAGKCVYLLSKAGPVFPSSLSHLPCWHQCDVGDVPARSWRAEIAFSDLCRPPAIGLHLLYQVLLI